MAPVARAVRAGLAASAAALALAGSGAALAQSCEPPVDGRVLCDGAFTDPVLLTPVDDITLVLGENAPTSVTVSGEQAGAGVLGSGALGIVSHADIAVDNAYDAIGLSAVSGDGPVAISTTGEIGVASAYGSAVAIYAAGTDTQVDNAGPLTANGYLWAAGIETEATGDATVANTGDITVTASAYDTGSATYGYATGIEAVGGDGAVVQNSGNILAEGTFAKGIYAYAGGAGGIEIDNDGQVVALAYTGYATGIAAATAVEGSDIAVDNSGAIAAVGLNGATGIDVLATGVGSSASVVNNGSIYAATATGTPYATYYAANGILVSGDGGVRVENGTAGSIEVVGGGAAYGVAAFAFAGDADVVNAGSISVDVEAEKYAPVAYGVLAASAQGSASVDNSGDISVAGGKYYASGITVSAYGDATVNNSGDISVDSQFGKYSASGVMAQSATGDITITNAEGGTIQTAVRAQGGVAFGMVGLASGGDVDIRNEGVVDVANVDQSLGISAVAQQGNAHAGNAGAISSASYLGIGVGMFARADYGNATIANTGDVYAYSDYIAYGAVARGANVGIDNAGSVEAIGSLLAFGLIATATADVDVANSGTLVTQAEGSALGVYAVSVDGGDVAVDNSGDIVSTSLNGLAQGIAAAGESVYAANSGSITASGQTWALGIEAEAGIGTADVANSGIIAVQSYANPAIGIYATSDGDVVVDNDGQISATAPYALADGIFAAGANVDVDNSGSIAATGFDWAVGIEAQANGGSTTVVSSGDITATATSLVSGYYGRAYGIYVTGAQVAVDNLGTIAANGVYATGIRAASVYADANIAVDNSGSIAANSYYGSTGIDVFATGIGSTGSVVNSGDIQVNTASRYGIAVGVVVSADGDANVDNTGDIGVVNASASAYNYYLGTRIYGVQALSFAGDAEVVNSGGIAVDAGIYSYAGYGVVAAAANGMATVDNIGSVDVAGGYLNATGILAQGQAGAAASNSGTVTVDSDVARYGAFGLQATSALGDASVDNSGLITVTSGEVPTAGALASGATANVRNSGQIDIAATFLGYGAVAFSQDGSAGVTNDGAITITTISGAAVAVNVQSETGSTATNTGTITATALTDTFGIIASAASGGVSVDNSGTITSFSDTPFNGNSNGIAVAAMGDALVDNSGAISAAGGKYATGISANSVTGDVQAFNSGSIAVGEAKYATGIEAIAQAGDVLVDNAASGTVSASASDGFALAMAGISQAGDVRLNNAGTVAVADDVSSEPYPSAVDAIGIYVAAASDASVDSSGAISARSTYGLAGGILAVGVNVDVGNSGRIEASGFDRTAGIEAEANGGAATVSSSGDIVATATSVDADYYGRAYGIDAAGASVTVHNGGAIAATGMYATGIQAASPGDIDITNAGAIEASGLLGAYGILAVSGQGDVVIDNAAGGSVSAAGAGGYVAAIRAQAGGDVDIAIVNAGDVTATGRSRDGGSDDVPGALSATALFGNAVTGAITLDNRGSITASNAYGSASGVFVFAGDDVAITTSGDIAARASGAGGAEIANPGAFGAYVYSGGNVSFDNAGGIVAESAHGRTEGLGILAVGRASVVNSGEIAASGAGPAYAVVVGGLGSAVIDNAGEITAESETDLAWGVYAGGGQVTVTNTGSITAIGPDRAIGVRVSGAGATIDNSGTIRAIALGDGRIAVRGLEGTETIHNSGSLQGAVLTGGGDDVVNNRARGTWLVDNGSTNLGDGDDAITNAVGGTIHLQDGTISLGAGDGNRFTNAGTLKVSGSGLIHMGTAAAVPETATAARSMAAIAPQAAVPSLNTVPLINSGVIDLVDGAADDSLTIVGDLGGNGSLNIDIDPAADASDRLLVDGSIAAGNAQTVNVAFDGFVPGNGAGGLLNFASVEFASVTGAAAADAFIGGDVIGFDPGNFLDLDVIITSEIDTSNATPDVFSAGVDVAGLNDTGAIAASIGSGAWSLMTSQIGTWRQRMGVVPEPGDGEGLSAFVRTFYDKGDVSPEHRAFNFGQRGNFDYQQLNSGTEVGLNFEPVAGFNLGLNLGKSRGKQTLADPGIASAHVAADTFGLYGTWIGQSGWYVDASYRAMRFDARLDSAAGRQRTDGKAGAINVETGYPFELGSGLRLEPQFQYTWTTVDSVFVQGAQTWLRTDDGDWHRSRLGLSLWQPFAAGAGLTWIPYGSASVVRVNDAKTGYTVGDAFHGNTSTEGTSALVELGVGLQKAGFSGTFGANWTDGGALESFLGGQLVLRYGW
jgi:hypothetical protein